MKTIISVLCILFFSCKKQSKEPVYTVNIQSYSKNTATLKLVDGTIQVKGNHAESIEVKDNQLEQSIGITGTDSLFLRVEFKGIVKEKSVKSTSINTISFQLNSF